MRAVALVGLLLLAGCSGEEGRAQETVRDSLVDPESARFGEFTQVGDKACLTVNSRNRMGGYTGDQEAILEKMGDAWRLNDVFETTHESCVDTITPRPGEVTNLVEQPNVTVPIINGM